MKNVLHNLKGIDRLVSETGDEIKVLETLPFFSIFSCCDTKEQEINKLRVILSDYLSAKLSILDNLQLEIEKEKIKVSQQMRENNLIKNGFALLKI